jgi:hypothetical protein
MAVAIHVSTDDDGMRTEPHRQFHGHRTMDPKLPSLIAACRNHCPIAHPPDNQRLANELTVLETLYAYKKRIQVQMSNKPLIIKQIHSNSEYAIIQNY